MQNSNVLTKNKQPSLKIKSFDLDKMEKFTDPFRKISVINLKTLHHFVYNKTSDLYLKSKTWHKLYRHEHLQVTFTQPNSAPLSVNIPHHSRSWWSLRSWPQQRTWRRTHAPIFLCTQLARWSWTDPGSIVPRLGSRSAAHLKNKDSSITHLKWE